MTCSLRLALILAVPFPYAIPCTLQRHGYLTLAHARKKLIRSAA